MVPRKTEHLGNPWFSPPPRSLLLSPLLPGWLVLFHFVDRRLISSFFVLTGDRGGRGRAGVVELQRLHPLLHAAGLRGVEDRGRLPVGAAQDGRRGRGPHAAQRRREMQNHVIG